MMRSLARWVLLGAFVLYGMYFMVWAFQDAMLSVPENPIAKANMETRALVFLPISIVLMAQGVLFFICLRQKKGKGQS